MLRGKKEKKTPEKVDPQLDAPSVANQEKHINFWLKRQGKFLHATTVRRKILKRGKGSGEKVSRRGKKNRIKNFLSKNGTSMRMRNIRFE